MKGRLTIGILLIWILFSVPVAFGAVEIEKVTFGFNDGYKAGTWAPVTITLRSGDAQLVFDGELGVEVRDFASDVPLERYITPVRLSPTGRQRKRLSVYCPKNATRLIVQLIPTAAIGSEVLESVVSSTPQETVLPTPIARKDYLVVVLAPSGDKLKRFMDKRVLAGSDDAQVHVKYLPNSTSLLRDWIGYSAVDLLVVRETFLTERHISKAQQTALLDWVQRGGTLILSGGGSFSTLQNSFIEPFLPVELKGLKKMDRLPVAWYAQLGLQASGSDGILFERIEFAPRTGCETLIGTEEQIYVAKRNFGEGQILCLAFDYNAPPFSEREMAEAFWNRLLSRHGKSPRHLADRYALALQHEEDIHEQFLAEMPTQVPLIKLLFVVLPVYLLSFGGFLFYVGKSKRRTRIYWIGGGLFVLLSVSTIATARHVLPGRIVADRLSILSVYPERQRAHLQSYVSLKAAAPIETSVDFEKGTFVRGQEVESASANLPQKIGTFVQGSRVHLRNLFIEPWSPTTYVRETFLDVQQLPQVLENAWFISGKEMAYVGSVALTDAPTFELSTGSLRRRLTPKIPPAEGLNGARKWFAQILRREQVLRHLAAERGTNPSPYLIGWTSQGFTDMMIIDGNSDRYDETFVIFRLDAE